MPKPIACLFSALFAFSLAAAEKRNIVIILSDDQSWTDYGFMGHAVIKTSHLDKLAELSVLFDRGYVASPLCRPSLASMVTGRYPTSSHCFAGIFSPTRIYGNRSTIRFSGRRNRHPAPSYRRNWTASHGPHLLDRALIRKA